MIDPKPPDFTDWTTPRLKFLLAEYRETVRSVRVLYGRDHEETRMYKAWVAALEAELEKRLP
jgi:hypothetical protein